METIYRLKSDNYDCFVSEAAYREITLQMSTGDYATHRARAVQLDPNQLEDLRYHGSTLDRNGNPSKERCFVDYHTDDCIWLFYDGLGDVYMEHDHE